MKRLSLFFIAGWLSACANHAPPPDWLLKADAARQAHARYWLEGRDKLASGQLALAREAVSRTGDASVMARIELHACAVRRAALDLSVCSGFESLSGDASQSERIYGNYLAGQLSNGDLEGLPETQRQVWRNPTMLKEIADPLSRLVAAGVLFQAGRLAPDGIAVAIDTASAQGWRRALLAWLSLDLERRRRAGDSEGTAAVERRIERLLKAGS